jgi:glycosyltransferase involved in cell wall biosynthesis
MQKTLIIANAHIKGGLSGGDNIYLHLKDHWKAEVWDMLDINFKPFLVCYVWRIVLACLKAAFCFKKYDFVYSASDFWMDSLPGFIMKLKGNKWIAGFYLFAPTTHKLYFYTQKVAYWLIQFSDMQFVTSEPDVKYFKKAFAIKGGIDLPIERHKVPKEYDALFIGRLHPQKGVIELLKMWRDKPYSLVIIGDGPLEQECLDLIHRYKLNAYLFGFREKGELEYFIERSKIVLHPAKYDSGGMAACQAMAYGLPAIGYDLEAFKTYYEDGMLKAVDDEDFMRLVKILLNNKTYYNYMSVKARAWAELNSWDNTLLRVDKYIGELC